MKLKHIFATVCVALFGAGNVSAQMQLMGTSYFQNEYLNNPAMAGMQEGLQLQGALRKQWSNIPGSPLIQSLTADYALKEKAGLGLNLYNDEAGLFKQTSVAGSYAYHLPLSETKRLHMGISLGMAFDRVMNERINGNPADASVGRFNQKETYIDGDFGLAYTSSQFSVQFAVPNLKQALQTDEANSVDRPTFFSAISYKWQLGEDLNSVVFIPKVVYRGVTGHDNLIDAGANLLLANNRLSFTGIYHNTKNASFGLGLNFQQYSFLGTYTSATGPLSGYTSGNFEVGLAYRVIKKKD
jgi:type IX secretion system PorP/SprF family membrane protein